MKKFSSVNGIHAQRLFSIRPYVNFNYDARKPFTDYQKRKIKKYFDEIDALTHRPFQVYRPRNRNNLKAAQELAQHEEHLPGLKVAFIPSAEPVTVRITKSGRASFKTKHVRAVHIELSPARLAKDPDKEIAKAMKQAKGAKNFHILCGRYEIRRPVNPKFLPERIKTLMGRYSPGGQLYRQRGDNEEASNHYKNWLHGLSANYFDKQASYEDYVLAKEKAAEKVKREKRNAKRRAKNARNLGGRLRN